MKKKSFSKLEEISFPMSNLTGTHVDSYQRFIKKGLPELFQEFFPIHDYSKKKFTLDLLGLCVDEPKHDEFSAKAKNLTLDAPLKLRFKLTNKEMNVSKEQEVFFADLPVITSRGTFVINGVERVIVPQIIKSFGVQFSDNFTRGKKYFSAKVIPSRGIWIEIETEADGVIYAKIDNKRKIPVSSLLRIFSLKTNLEIEKAFSKVDVGPVAFIKKTIEKDIAKTQEESYVELYKRLRPGEPIDMLGFENSKNYIDALLDSERYDLSLIGRYQLNLRLGKSSSIAEEMEKMSKRITLEDIVGIVSKIIEMNNDPSAIPDDIDNLGTRRVRRMEELLQQKLRANLIKMKRHIQDRMSTADPSTLMPAQIVNGRPFAVTVKDFFTTNQLSQFMSQKNTLDELEHLRRLSALGPGGVTRERAGFEVRDVHPSHYGKICPIQTPEGPSIGLVVNMAVYARINDFGILETPYRKVVDGRVTNEVVYLNAIDEGSCNIAHAEVKYNRKTGELDEEEVEGRISGHPGLADKKNVQYMDVAANQAYSVGTSLIPFLDHDDATRALMGSNMQKQGVPCVRPETPLVGTGMEERAAKEAGRMILCEEDGVVDYVDALKIIVKNKDKKKKEYKLASFLRTNDLTALHHRPSVSVGDQVKEKDVLADNYTSDNGHLALGQNALVAFMSWRGLNFEDAVVISERLVQEDKFTSVHLEEFSVYVRETKLGPEITTYDIPNIGEEKLKNLDEDGIIRIGAEVRADDILVGKTSPKGEVELTPEERLLRSIFGDRARDVKDSSLRLDHGKQGRVVSIKVFSREMGDKLEPGVIKRIFVEIAKLRKISVGDKLAGRHGNKGIVSMILPVEDMPYLEDGTPIDMILNPLGVVSRMNIGQILETHLGWAAEKLGYNAVTPGFHGATEEEIKEELKKAGLPEDGKIKLYDGRSGEAFEQKITVGQIYMMKLNHMVEDKIHMRSIGPYSLITQQPLGGKAQGGGQRFGEMEVWALEGYGAAHTLQEILTIKSDDISGRASVYNSIIREEKFKSPNLPAAFHVLTSELRGLGLDMEITNQEKTQDIENETE